MDNIAVCQLMKDTHFEGFLLVRGAEKKTDRNGRDYVDMNLADRTGEINSKIWNWTEAEGLPRGGSVIWVRGAVQEYNGRIQMKVEKWRNMAEGDSVDMNRLTPSAPRSSADMTAEIRDTLAGFKNQSLRRVTEEMLRMAGEKLEYFPAAQRMHHAERSGLLHHTTDMLRLARGILQVYDWLDADLLLAGVIIHDLAKIDELRSDRAGNVSDYTRDGQLIGHLVRGVVNLNRAAEKCGVGGETLVLLEHMLLSHHGEPEYGSPRPPMFAEAEALHWIDMMDARMNTMKSMTDKTPEGAFSEKAYSLERRVYHPRYREDAE